MPETTTTVRPGLECSCLLEEGKAPRRSYACPQHGCTCGTGRRSALTHRGARDSSCPRHGDHTTATAPAAPLLLPPLDPQALVEVDVAILALEKEAWHAGPRMLPGVKDARASRVLGGAYRGITPTRYYQRLNQLIDHPEANRREPALMARLREQRKDH